MTVPPPPPAFEAFEDTAAYVEDVPRGRAIALARDVCSTLRDDYQRSELRVRRVFMRPVGGREADEFFYGEFFYGEFESGWVEVSHRPLTTAQRANLIPMWKVEPR